MKERTLIKDLPSAIGKTVHIAGWVDVRRDHGKLIFLDIRDRSGIVQAVATPKAAEALDTAKKLRAQWVVEIEGELRSPVRMNSPNSLPHSRQAKRVTSSSLACAGWVALARPLWLSS